MSVFILDAVRTPRGKARPDGGLAALKPQQLVAHLLQAIEDRGHSPRKAQGLVLGSVGQVGAQGGHIALVSKLHARLDDSAFAISINNYCASGLSAVIQASHRLAAGDCQSVLAGGVEMMSRVPFMADKADYYTDPDFDHRARFVPVPVAADRLAEECGIDRKALDTAAFLSQQRTAAVEGTALVASRIATNGLGREEPARPHTTLDFLSKLTPAFGPLSEAYEEGLENQSIDHRHTIGHAPPMADGAGLALLSSCAKGARARIVASVEIGGDPRASLTAGFDAMDKVLVKADLTLADMDRIEFMEAFAVVIAKFLRDYDVDVERVNVGGGHLAKGHPMGATGTILLSSLLDALDACKGRYGLVVVSGAQGVGAAMIVERLELQR